MQRALPEQASSRLAITGDGDRLALEGVLDIRSLREASDALSKWFAQHKPHALDLANLTALDTPGAQFLCALNAKGVELTGVRDEHKALLDLICGLEQKPLPPERGVSPGRQLVIELGKGADDAWHDTRDVITFVGRPASAIRHALLHLHSMRLP